VSTDRVLPVVVPLLGATEALAALGAVLRARRDGLTLEPQLAERLDAVLDALGVHDAVTALDEDETTALLGIVEGFLAQSADFVVSPGRKGWDHEQPSILMAQGHSSVMVAELLRRFVVPALGDLSARLDDERAAFLDIGAGVAALAVAMCRLWPSLRVVGIDPWAPALALARERVSEAGLEERIELRQAVAETLDDEARYDLAWVPTFFISGTVLDRVIERVHAALRPGGWATLGLYAAPDIPLAGAVTDLRTVRHGGAMQTPQEMAAQMVRAGFSDVDVLFDAAWGRPMMFVAGRRTEAS